MNPKLLLLSFLLLICFSPVALAQQMPSCGFDVLHQKEMKNNPAYRKAVLQHEQFAKDYMLRHSARGMGGQSAIIMPVVIHIVHTGDVLGSIYNPTDAQIQNVMTYLNQVYAGTYYGQGVGDLGVQFALAQRDPNCNPTNGINHINGSSLTGYTANGVNFSNTNGTDQHDLKNFIRWDPTRYCNVWVVNKIDGIDGYQGGGTGGFAYFPFDPTIDGVVVRAHEMQVGISTLPHEMGHTFTLYHPFEGSTGPTSNICPPNGDPGDMVSDTDPVTNPNFFDPERTGPNPCTVPPNQPYTSNTERNIMSYVFTPTLFTAGQKTRLQAGAADPNRVNQENSLGNIAPSQGATTCPPKIDFELSEYQVTEVTAGTTSVSGCARNYKDYSFNLLIGNNPSAAATATLTASGTAQEGVDFDITTNGNFTTPSKIITFPAGANAAKAFTVRIYDDAIVESTETLTLGFTVNSGGGNAVAGDGRTNLNLTIFDNDTAPYASSNTSYTLNGTFNFSATVPFAGNTNQLKSQQLYKASELTAAGLTAGNLVALSVDLIKSTASTFKYKSFTIKLKQTTQTALFDYTSSTGSPVADAGFTTVYSADYFSVNGTNTFNFSTPFAWDGTSSIAVDICYDNGGVTDPNNDAVNFYSDDYSADNASFVYQNSVCGAAFSTFTYYNNDYKPVITFIRNNPGTVVQDALNSSKQEYLGPNADVYFYDQTSGDLLARVKNLSAFNYGCTQVIIDRAGTSSVQFWNNSTPNYLMNKTFHILPTTNNPSGQYEATFYYTPAEVNGWQTATGQSFSSIQLVKVPGQIMSVTPANPNAAGPPLVVVPARGTLGTNYSLDYTFSNGFSGFGAGVVGLALPVHLLDFTGRLENNTAVLSWQTAEEINSSVFEIERSYDGQVFSKIGTVAAAGNSSATNNYSYTDRYITQKINYYRLKMIDKDGHFEYSTTILLNSTFNTLPFSILTNPVHNSLDMQFGNIPGGHTEIRLLDITGRLLQRWTETVDAGQRIRIPLNGSISQGIYTVQVVQGNNQFVGKIIKE